MGPCQFLIFLLKALLGSEPIYNICFILSGYIILPWDLSNVGMFDMLTFYLETITFTLKGLSEPFEAETINGNSSMLYVHINIALDQSTVRSFDL